MAIILDTCALLSLVGLTDKKLSKPCLAQIKTADKVYLSSCVIFEIAIKHKKQALDLGKFANAKELWEKAITEYQLTELSINYNIFYKSALLPNYHKDPFDRLIIAQASKLGIPVVTFDSMFSKYDIDILS